MNSLEITLRNTQDDEVEKIILKRVKRNNLSKLIELQRLLLEEFIYFNASIGSLVSDPKSWKNIEKICTLIPVVPSKTLADYLSYLEDDIDLLTKLFFTDSWDNEAEDYIDGQSFKPSLLSKLNRLDYTGDLGKGILLAGMKKEKELNSLREEIQPPEVESLSP
jgi:hypothetical protein